jgi:hypothetical protein
MLSASGVSCPVNALARLNEPSSLINGYLDKRNQINIYE